MSIQNLEDFKSLLSELAHYTEMAVYATNGSWHYELKRENAERICIDAVEELLNIKTELEDRLLLIRLGKLPPV